MLVTRGVIQNRCLFSGVDSHRSNKNNQETGTQRDTIATTTTRERKTINRQLRHTIKCASITQVSHILVTMLKCKQNELEEALENDIKSEENLIFPMHCPGRIKVDSQMRLWRKEKERKKRCNGFGCTRSLNFVFFGCIPIVKGTTHIRNDTFPFVTASFSFRSNFQFYICLFLTLANFFIGVNTLKSSIGTKCMRLNGDIAIIMALLFAFLCAQAYAEHTSQCAMLVTQFHYDRQWDTTIEWVSNAKYDMCEINDKYLFWGGYERIENRLCLFSARLFCHTIVFQLLSFFYTMRFCLFMHRFQAKCGFFHIFETISNDRSAYLKF